MFNMILFGPPGSGKGTQSIRIAEKYNLAHISTGDIFRCEIKNKTPLGLRVKDVIERGELVPDELLEAILVEDMNKHTTNAGFIFDGFPRTIRQAKDLDILLKKTDDCVSLVLALNVNEEETVQRLLNRAQEQGRKDDSEKIIRNRMKVYHRQTSPLINFYKKQDKFISMQGMGTIDDIFENVCKIIDKHI